MTWTYSTLNMVDTDKVRLLCGDTLESEPFLQNEEIDLFLSLTDSNLLLAGQRSALAIAAKLSREADLATQAGLSVRLSQRAESFRKTASDLLTLNGGAITQVPIPTGLSRGGAVNSSGTDVPPAFYRGLLNSTEQSVLDRSDS